MSKDYYKILGVEKGATEDDIKKAYRKLAHQHHPDKSGGDESKFKEINEAYQILSNKDKRTQYDRFGRVFEGGQGGAGGPYGPGGFDFRGFQDGFEFGFDPNQFGDLGNVGEIFDAFFEGMGVKRRKTYTRGSDMEVVQEIILEEAFRGVASKFKLQTMVACSTCAGQGHDVKAGTDKCETCDGKGEIKESRSTFFGNFAQVKSCAKCFGTGQIPKKVCKECKGAGRVKGTREISVQIVPGVADGQIIKVAGAGEAGERGAATGDLYIHIKVKPHPAFARQGDDLYVKKEINALDILLKKKIEIPTIPGSKLMIEIPSGHRLSEQLRIPGEGMPRFNSHTRGDLYVKFDVAAPGKLSSKAQKLLEELDKEVG